MKSVGFIVDGLLPFFSRKSLARLGPLSVFKGGRSATAMGLMRFGWIADAVNNRPGSGVRYELYRPFRRYDALVFTKSMDRACLELARRQRKGGGIAVFDVNVNYFEAGGTYYYEGMQPTNEQRANAIAMAKECSGTIAASLAIEEAAGCSALATCIPDNVDLRISPKAASWSVEPAGRRLRLLWSGQALKLFDLLAIEDVLRAFRENTELVLVTNDLSALERVYEPHRSRLKKLLADLHCTVIRYESIPRLMEVYGAGGVMISPRFLDSAYNRGHPEGKITLGMACGRVAVCSPLRSYREVARLSGGVGVRICDDSGGWSAVLDSMLGGRFDWAHEQASACKVVSDHYSSAVVAEKHAEFITQLMEARS
jgi:hypothetical protein